MPRLYPLSGFFSGSPKQRHQPSRLFFLPGRKQASAHGEKLGGISQASKVRRISDQAQAAQRFHPHRRAHQLGLSARLSQLAAYNAQQRTFSRAVSAQKAHHLARGHRKIQAVQRQGPSEAPGEATDAEGGTALLSIIKNPFKQKRRGTTRTSLPRVAAYFTIRLHRRPARR